MTIAPTGINKDWGRSEKSLNANHLVSSKGLLSICRGINIPILHICRRIGYKFHAHMQIRELFCYAWVPFIFPFFYLFFLDFVSHLGSRLCFRHRFWLLDFLGA